MSPPAVSPPAISSETLALVAGLARAWADQRADVEEAIAAAQRMRASFARPTAPEAEPMPAYAAPVADTAVRVTGR